MNWVNWKQHDVGSWSLWFFISLFASTWFGSILLPFVNYYFIPLILLLYIIDFTSQVARLSPLVSWLRDCSSNHEEMRKKKKCYNTSGNHKFLLMLGAGLSNSVITGNAPFSGNFCAGFGWFETWIMLIQRDWMVASLAWLKHLYFGLKVVPRWFKFIKYDDCTNAFPQHCSSYSRMSLRGWDCLCEEFMYDALQVF